MPIVVREIGLTEDQKEDLEADKTAVFEEMNRTLLYACVTCPNRLTTCVIGDE